MTESGRHTAAEKKILVWATLILTYFFCTSVKAIPPPGPSFTIAVDDMINIMTTVFAALGTLAIAYYGVLWITASDLSERDNAKRAIAYTIIGLILLVTARRIVWYLLL